MYFVYSEGGQQLSNSEVDLLEKARSTGLEGYHFLSLDAAKHGAHCYKLQPTFHKLDESVRLACRTHRSPAWWWTFADESWIGMVSKLANSTHIKSLSRRVVERWLATLLPNFAYKRSLCCLLACLLASWRP